jgi:ATP-dependent protease HslVU (ClpYQ) peptidase subunit
MSTIVAVEKDKSTAVAWDGLSMFGSTRRARAVERKKVHRLGDAVVGCAGFSVYQNVLDHYIDSLEPTDFTCERDVFEFFLDFRRRVTDRYTLVNEQYDRDDLTPFADLGAEFVVASVHGIFVVGEILSVARFDAFCAIGSGAPHAEGALEVLYSQNLTAHEIAKRAVEVAAIYDGATGSDCSVIDLPH